MNAGTTLPAGTVLRRRFELTEILGRGATGTVYRAVDHRWRCADGACAEAAVKVGADGTEAGRRIRYEGHVLRHLDHPGIVRPRGAGRADGLVFLALDLLPGGTLADRLGERAGRGLDGVDALRITRDLGAALAHLHRLGLVHGDVKPGNVMFALDGRAVLIDFATATSRRAARAGGVSSSPWAGDLTPAYASPSRLAGHSPDHRDDVFSLAVLACTMLAGRHPCAGRPVTGRFDRPPGLDGPRWAVLRRGLAPQAAARPGDAAAFADRLRRPRPADRLRAWCATIAAADLGPNPAPALP